jgi:hypothetical protein
MIQSKKNVVLGILMILVPLLFLIGFASHPNLGSLSVMKNAADWVREIRHNEHLQAAHLLVLLGAGMLILIAVGLAGLIEEKTPVIAYAGLLLVIFGSVALAADKGALCLVPSALDTLSDAQYSQMLPGFQAMLDKKSLLGVVNLIFLLPVGFITLSAGLLKAKQFPRWQPILMILSMLLFINPDIDLISLFGSVLLLISMGGMGLSIMKKQNRSAAA